MGCVYVYVIILTLVGPEYKGRSTGVAHDHDLEEAAGQDAVENVAHLRGSDEDQREKV